MNLHDTQEPPLSLEGILKSCEELGRFRNVKIPKKPQTQDPSIQNFQEIIDFFEEHGREPKKEAAGKEKSLFVRLNAMRKNPSEDLLSMDTYNLLSQPETIMGDSLISTPTEEAIESPSTKQNEAVKSLSDIFSSASFAKNIALDTLGDDSILDKPIKKISNTNEGKNLELIEKTTKIEEESFKRTKCEDFWRYEAYLSKTQEDINTNSKNITTKKYSGENINVGDLFIYDGLLCFVADKTPAERKNGKKNFRLRVVFSNGLEIKVLMFSLATMLRRTDLNKKITLNESKEIKRRVNNDFSDLVTGYIYILKLQNTPDRLAGYPNLFKVGFTTTSVEKRIMNSENDPTFLEEKVECVQVYECSGNINPQVLETMIHAFLSHQRLGIKLKSKKGQIYSPHEWFDVEYDTINEIVSRTVDGSISDYRMNNTTGRLVKKTP